MPDTYVGCLSPNGSMCPECKSPNIEIWMSSEDGDYYLKCGDCGHKSEVTGNEFAVKILWLV